MTTPTTAGEIRYASAPWINKEGRYVQTSEPGKYILLHQFFPEYEIATTYSMDTEGRVAVVTAPMKSSKPVSEGASSLRLILKYNVHGKLNPNYGKNFNTKKLFDEVCKQLKEIYLREGTVGSPFFDELVATKI